MSQELYPPLQTTTGLTDAELRATPVPVSDGGGSLTVDGPLTDAQLRASAVPISDNGGSLTVDGTVAVSSVGGTVAVSAASLPLPTGAATAAGQPALGTAGTPAADVITVQGIASMTALKVDGSAVTQPVSGTVTVQDGGGSLTIDDGGGSITVDGTLSVATDTHDSAAGTGVLLSGAYASASAPVAVSADGDAVRLWASRTGVLQVGDGGATLSIDDGAGSITVDGTVAVSGTVAVTDGGSSLTVDDGGSSITIDGTLDVRGPATSNSVAGGNYYFPVTGYGSSATPTAIGGDGRYVPLWADTVGRLHVQPPRSSTATTSQVSDAASSTQLLAANTSRIGATVYNDSAAILYVKCGTTASTTDYTAQLPPGGYWESPFGYTGRIDGLWEFDPNSGAARITEYT